MTHKENLIEKEETTKENRIWIRIASACNIKCIFCLDENAQDGTLVPEEEVTKKIETGFKPGVYNRVILSGGEASINPKFPHYIAYAKEVGYDRVQTVTNGNMFSSSKFCEKVFGAGLDEVTFSFHGHTSRLHDYLVDVPGSFQKALKGLIYIKKYHPNIIINIDIVVNKVNVKFLPEIVKFFMKLGVYEYDILHIIPFGRGFDSYKDILFYNIEEYLDPLHKTWELSRTPGMYMWTNRFPVEAFEGYEDLIQDPRKISSEVMTEGYDMYYGLITSQGEKKPSCYGSACEHCFLHQYCHDFLGNTKKYVEAKDTVIINETSIQELKKNKKQYVALRGELFPSDVYEKFGTSGEDFKDYIQNLPLRYSQELLNVPKCLREDNNVGKYEYYPDTRKGTNLLEEYTSQYVKNFYRVKSTRCSTCKYNKECQGIHVNFIRSYGFKILEPI